jgi:hypothetical protein
MTSFSRTRRSQTAPSSPPLLAGPGFGRPYSLAAVPPLGPFNHLFLHPGLTHTHDRSLMLSFGHSSSHYRVSGLLPDVDVDGVPEPTSQRPPPDAIPLGLHHLSSIATYK